MLDRTLAPFAAMTAVHAAAWLLLLNLIMFGLSIGVGHLLVLAYHDRPVSAAPDPIEWQEWALAFCSILLNTAVAIAGWYLWRNGYITVRRSTALRTAIDVLVLFFAMDLLMYLFHRVAHIRWLFPWLHATHHHYDRPRPLNLFVLNPAEVLGFGCLWLLVLCLYSATWSAILIYLAINLAFGTLGHLGVEPFPRDWAGGRFIRHLGSSTFHANHHGDRDVNFGFYTDLWDHLFRTHRLYVRRQG